MRPWTRIRILVVIFEGNIEDDKNEQNYIKQSMFLKSD